MYPIQPMKSSTLGIRMIRPSSSSNIQRRFAGPRHFHSVAKTASRKHLGEVCDLKRFQRQTVQKTMRRHRFSSTAAEEVVEEPSYNTLKIIALGQAIPFIGFGFMDNAILIVAGDAIDTYLGVTLGISTLCAAAIGNIISDLAGIGLGTAIEDFCANRLKLPTPDLSTAQRQLRRVRFAGQMGMALGMTFGCIV
mmetsp:Transcript_44718/g.107911  ORF Transcript_44718/g.107911 Transcript_44718/m.107911 type:complete len:194 (+) Transcript_44718:367-948(+)